MKPWLHAKSTARKYGGRPEEYIKIHDFFDSSKSSMPDMRHRAILHSSFGIFVLEKVFGTIITNSIGKEISVRDIGEQHVIEDLGFIPTMERWLKNLPSEDWMFGSRRGENKSTTRLIPFDNLLDELID